jgi:hypothetical protein
MEAAEIGSIADRSAATDQVEIVLSWRSLLTADPKAPSGLGELVHTPRTPA